MCFTLLYISPLNQYRGISCQNILCKECEERCGVEDGDVFGAADNIFQSTSVFRRSERSETRKQKNVSPGWQELVVQVCFCHSSETIWGNTRCLSHTHTSPMWVGVLQVCPSDTLSLHVIKMKKVRDHSIDVCFGHILTQHLQTHMHNTDFSSIPGLHKHSNSGHQRSTHHLK